jgi:hypothetical protein
MVIIESKIDEFHRPVLEVYVQDTFRPRAVLEDDKFKEALEKCEIIRVINHETGELIAEFKKVTG